MKFSISFEEINKVVTTAGTVAGGVKDAVVEMTLGEKRINEKMRCLMTCFAGIEQNSTMFYSDMPKDSGEGIPEDGKEQKPVVVAFDAKVFQAVMQSLLALKECIYIEVVPGVAYVGIEGKARIPLQVLSADAVPERIALDKNEIICQFKASSEKLIKAIKAGSSQVMNTPSSNGLNNAVISVAEDTLTIYSMDGKAMASACCNITKAPSVCSKNASGEKVMIDLKTAEEEYCQSKKLSEMMVAVPKKVISDIIKLIGEASEVAVCLTSRNIFIAPQTTSFFVGCLGANIFTGVTKMGLLKESPKEAVAVVDAEKAKASLELLQKCMDANAGGKKIAVRFTICEDSPLRMEKAAEGDDTVRVDVIEAESNAEVSRCLDGKRVIEILSVMEKGNLRIAFPEDERQPVAFCNGTIDSIAENSAFSLLAPIKYYDSESESAEASSGQEIEEADGKAMAGQVVEE